MGYPEMGGNSGGLRKEVIKLAHRPEYATREQPNFVVTQ